MTLEANNLQPTDIRSGFKLEGDNWKSQSFERNRYGYPSKLGIFSICQKLKKLGLKFQFSKTSIQKQGTLLFLNKGEKLSNAFRLL